MTPAPAKLWLHLGVDLSLVKLYFVVGCLLRLWHKGLPTPPLLGDNASSQGVALHSCSPVLSTLQFIPTEKS